MIENRAWYWKFPTRKNLCARCMRKGTNLCISFTVLLATGIMPKLHALFNEKLYENQAQSFKVINRGADRKSKEMPLLRSLLSTDQKHNTLN